MEIWIEKGMDYDGVNELIKVLLERFVCNLEK